jgi:hypothetical protein
MWLYDRWREIDRWIDERMPRAAGLPASGG